MFLEKHIIILFYTILYYNIKHITLFLRKRSINCNFPYLCQSFVDFHKIRLNFTVLNTKESIGSSLKRKLILSYVMFGVFISTAAPSSVICLSGLFLSRDNQREHSEIYWLLEASWNPWVSYDWGQGAGSHGAV